MIEPNEPRRNRWWIVFGCTVAMIFSLGPLLQFTFGVFLVPVSNALHVGRGRISLALFVGLAACGLLTPLVGYLVDRFGVRRVGALCIVLFASSFALIGLVSTSVWIFIGCYGLAGIFGAGQTTLIYSKAITGAFDSNRGLALGMSISGVGIGTALVPRLAEQLVMGIGWRYAYLVLGAVTLAVALPALLLFVRIEEPAATHTVTRDRKVVPEGLTRSEVLRSRLFWVMAMAFFLVSVALAAVMAHLIPMLTDRGVPGDTAELALSAGGIALILGRLIAGYLLDLVFGPYVALFYFSLPLVGIVILLAHPSIALSVMAGIMIGSSIGAEVDLIAYLQARYFGLRQFGEIYGYLLAIFVIGAGLGPVLLGYVYTHFGSYFLGLIGLCVCLVCSCVAMTTFPAYSFGTNGRCAIESDDKQVSSELPPL